jgi:hypothetical protein
MPKKGQLGIGTGPRPQAWKTGPDPVVHEKYRAWVQCRNQAQWRGEIWKITFEQWQQMWTGKWDKRGRSSDALCITRCDMSLPWSEANAIIISRREHGRRKTGTRSTLGESAASVVLTRS